MSVPLPIPAALAVDVEPFSDDDVDHWVSPTVKVLEIDGEPTGHARVANFVVDDDRVAEWAARKFADQMSVVADVKAQADEWRERINDWEQAETKRARSRASFFEERLTGYLARLRRESEFVKKDGTVDWRVKSVSLPSATLKSSRQAARVKLAESEDAQALAVEWCESNGQSDAVKRSLLVSKLSGVSVKDGRAVAEGGEVVPGLAVEPESVTYKVVVQ